jgi:hypothetical protein
MLTKNEITNLAAVIFSGMTSVQPIINAIEGAFTKKDVVQLCIAFSGGVIGYYTGKTFDGKAPTLPISTNKENCDGF